MKVSIRCDPSIRHPLERRVEVFDSKKEVNLGNVQINTPRATISLMFRSCQLRFWLIALTVALAGAGYNCGGELSPQVHHERSRDLAAKGDLPAAIEEVRKSIQIDPSSAEAHDNLGALLTAHGDLKVLTPCSGRQSG